MTRALRTTAAVSLCAALLASGCGGGSSPSAAAPTGSQSSTVAVPTDLPASDLAASSLRSSLTASLTERAYLTGIAMATGIENGFDANGYRAAERTLRANAIRLSDTVTRSYDTSSGKQLRALLVAHTVLYARYAQARKDGDAAAARRARDALRADDGTFGRVIASLKAQLTAAEIESAAVAQTRAMLAAIDAAAARDVSFVPRLRTAASGSTALALRIARGIAAQQPKLYPGAVDDAPTRLRAELTAMLTEHVALTALTIDAGVNAGFGDRAYHAAAAPLERNTEELTDTIGRAIGGRGLTRVRGPLLELQREAVTYARAQHANDGAASRNAQEAIDSAHDAFGTALEDVDDDYDHGQLSGALGAYGDAIAAFGRADASGSPKVFDRIDDAARQMPRVAQLIARGVAVKQTAGG